MESIEKLYYTIGEVSEATGLKQYVLRYWETEFQQLHPIKNRSGNRVYTKEDIQTVQDIKRLLYEEKYTIEGAKRRLSERVTASADTPEVRTILEEMKEEVRHLIDEVDKTEP